MFIKKIVLLPLTAGLLRVPVQERKAVVGQVVPASVCTVRREFVPAPVAQQIKFKEAPAARHAERQVGPVPSSEQVASSTSVP